MFELSNSAEDGADCEAPAPAPDPCAGVVCSADSPCTVAGTCADGVCPAVAADDGTVCDDGDGGTNIDVCTSGVCAGTHQAVCNKGADITGISFMDPEDGLLKASTSGDGVVNIEDILGILSQYRREGCGNFADVTGPSGVADCVVGIHDLLYVLANFRCAVATPDGGDQGR